MINNNNTETFTDTYIIIHDTYNTETDNNNNNLVEIYCNITSQIKNCEAEAFNLICLLKGNRVAYLLKSSQNLHKYLLFKNYLDQLNISYLGYVEINDNCPKMLIYNDIELEKQPILCEYLENIINNAPNRKQYISYLLQHMCLIKTLIILEV